MTEPRLFVASTLAEGATITLDESQAHYLASVLRRNPGQTVRLFNGRDGEWRARIVTLSRRGGEALLLARIRTQMPEDGPILLAPVLRRETTEWMVEKATELGAAAILLTTSARSAVTRTNPDRLAAIATEAAEQCGRLTVPRIDPPQALERRLADWPKALKLVVCDETGTSPPLAALLAVADRSPRPPAILVGPEGGFAPGELDRLRNLPFSLPASLGPRTLRAETAAVASLALVQALAGDWRSPQAAGLSVPS